jgi:hypothetical protein
MATSTGFRLSGSRIEAHEMSRIAIIAPMTRANMRQNGVRSLLVQCTTCPREVVVNVDPYPDAVPVPALRAADGLHRLRFDRHRCPAELERAAGGRGYVAMKRPAKNPDPREWRVSIVRQRLTYLGRVYAPDLDAAEVAATEQFGLTEEQRRRLVLQEQP